MVAITTNSGQQVEVDDAGISLLVGPYPLDVGPHTYVYSARAGVIVTAEAAVDSRSTRSGE
jgi:hypothetical protein